MTVIATITEVQEYLKGANGVQHDEDIVRSALDAEAAAQAHRCIIPEIPPADLREALCRRVAVNLAVRPLTKGIEASVSPAGVGFARVGGRDAEVQRLEAPYRRMVVG